MTTTADIIFVKNNPSKTKGCWRFRPPLVEIIFNRVTQTTVARIQGEKISCLMGKDAQRAVDEIMKAATAECREITSRLALGRFNEIAEALLILKNQSLGVSLTACLERFIQERFALIIEKAES